MVHRKKTTDLDNRKRCDPWGPALAVGSKPVANRRQVLRGELVADLTGQQAP
jgi:hypothetical protein